ncbi:MAG TPA: solute carrier family 23 protein [Rectinemataceae bacterium]|nr:solute carrier family 23 protein [Rectinemataceae bacterium]
MAQFAKIYDIEDVPPLGKAIPLSFQHVFAMFGATILVPLLTGLDPSVTIFCSGVGTLIFHLVNKGKVPAYLGSSFAFIAPIIAVSKTYGAQGAFTGMIAAGFVYILVFVIIAIVGLKWINRVLPPIVVGPIVMIIGLSLTPVAISEASKGLVTALITTLIVIVASIFGKGFLKIIPILLGTVGGYIVAIISGQVDFTSISNAAWIALPRLTIVTGHMPVLAWGAVAMIAPVAIATMVEDVGHLLVIGDTVERDLMHNPGLHKVLLGNGLATSVAGFLGGVPETTYGENIGVLAITRVFSSRVIQGAAVIAILLSFIQKFGAAIQTIPQPVLGGVTIILYGMIASVGLRTLIENKVDMAQNRNLLIASVIFSFGVGGMIFKFSPDFEFAGIASAAISGIILNLILPMEKKKEAAK